MNQYNKSNKKTVCDLIMIKLSLLFIFVEVLYLIGYTSPTNASDYTLSMTTSGSVKVKVSDAGNGTAVGTDTLTINSTCPNGYIVRIEGPSDRSLYKDGNNNNNAVGTFIAPSIGTATNPAIITGENQGTWGYSLTSKTGTESFIGLTDTQTTLINKDSASEPGGDIIPVYYGVSVKNTHAPGNYKMANDSAIAYYLTVNEDCISYKLSFNANGGTGTMPDQRIYEGITTPVNSSTFTPPTGKTFDSWNTNTDGSGITYEAGQNVTDISPVGTTLPLYAQWRDTCTGANRICYFKNAPDNEVEGTMGEQTTNDNSSSITGDISVTLLASNFSRTGYGFAGWNTKPNYTGKFYGPSETITTPSDMSEGLPLYAVWIQSEGSFQDSNKVATVCSNLTQAPIDGTASLNSVSALTDQRDNNTYAIAKLADGKCWMIENLRLDNTAEHNSDGSLAQGYGTSSTYGNFGGLANPESSNFSNVRTANSLYYSGTQSGTASINIGTTNYPAHRMPRHDNVSTKSRASNPTKNDSVMYSYGNYYTWAAAIADLTHYNTTNLIVENTSLCPKGWRLPTGGMAYTKGSTSGVNVTGDPSTFREYYNLGYIIMGSNKTAYEDHASSGESYYGTSTFNPYGDNAIAAFRKYPNNLVYSGWHDTSTVSRRGTLAGYWTSASHTNDMARTTEINTTAFYPGTNQETKFHGMSIRCIKSS